MLYYKNQRFHMGGLSYALPEDICIITKNSINGFAYTSPDGNITVIINTDCKSEILMKAAQIVEFGGIEGAYVYSGNNKEEFCEIRFKLPRPTESEKILTIKTKVIKAKLSIREAVKLPLIANLLASIRIDFSEPVFID